MGFRDVCLQSLIVFVPSKNSSLFQPYAFIHRKPFETTGHDKNVTERCRYNMKRSFFVNGAFYYEQTVLNQYR
jgi:hypothetical protein